MKQFIKIISVLAPVALGTTTALAYNQEFSNNTPYILEVTTGYSLWGDRSAVRLRPGEMATIDTGVLYDHKYVSDVLCLNEIRVRVVPPSEGDKPTAVFKNAAELGSPDADFVTTDITWVNDTTLDRINRSIFGAVEAFNLTKNIITKAGSTLASVIGGAVSSVKAESGAGIASAINGLAEIIGSALTAFDLTNIPKLFAWLTNKSLCMNRRFDIVRDNTGKIFVLSLTK